MYFTLRGKDTKPKSSCQWKKLELSLYGPVCESADWSRKYARVGICVCVQCAMEVYTLLYVLCSQLVCLTKVTTPIKVEEKKTCSFTSFRSSLAETDPDGGEHRVHTQSGTCRFLAYIPLWWKNYPRLVRVGGARPPPFTIVTFKYKVAVYAPAERPATTEQAEC